MITKDIRYTEEFKRAAVFQVTDWGYSGFGYEYRKIHDDLLSLGERCCPNRMAELIRHFGVKAQIGYKKKPHSYGVKTAVVATNELKQSFDILSPIRFG